MLQFPIPVTMMITKIVAREREKKRTGRRGEKKEQRRERGRACDARKEKSACARKGGGRVEVLEYFVHERMCFTG